MNISTRVPHVSLLLQCEQLPVNVAKCVLYMKKEGKISTSVPHVSLLLQCEQLPVHVAECALYKEKDIYATWEDVTDNTLTMDFMGAFRLLLAIRTRPELRLADITKYETFLVIKFKP